MTAIEYESELERKKTNNLKTFSFYTIFSAFLLAIGFVGGKIYVQQNLNTVYILDEHKFFKLVAVGFATDQKDQSNNQSLQEEINAADREKLRGAMQKFVQVLKEEYKKHPVLVFQKDRKGYDIYGYPKRIDITNDVIIKIIGKEKWKEIGKVFLR